jgi:glycosyltransferase involved in cell wall biosynthesis
MRPPLGSSHLRLTRAHAVSDLVARVRPDVIMERYHNFGGEAIIAAKSAGAVALLEVNAPVIDHPGSRKAWLDRALLVRPMRGWRQHLCRLADVIVTPNVAILPRGLPADRVLVLEWGADTERFRPGVAGPAPFTRPDVATLAVFAGAFRNWHGAIHLVRAIKTLRARGRTDIGAVLIGDGPERPRVREEASGVPGILFAGALPHDAMPAALAASDIGVAPFDLQAHAPLLLGFYWSPLKIFEYMAAGLPVVAPAVDRIPALVAHEREGLLYDPRDPDALAAALEQLTDPAPRARLGAAARDRALRDYSWRAHCRALEAAMLRARARRTA